MLFVISFFQVEGRDPIGMGTTLGGDDSWLV